MLFLLPELRDLANLRSMKTWLSRVGWQGRRILFLLLTPHHFLLREPSWWLHCSMLQLSQGAQSPVLREALVQCRGEHRARKGKSMLLPHQPLPSGQGQLEHREVWPLGGLTWKEYAFPFPYSSFFQ